MSLHKKIKAPWKIAFCAVLSIYFVFSMALFLSKTSLGELGQIGDSFGTLNSLFSGLGFAGLTLTIYLQQRQFESERLKNIKNEEESRSLYNLNASLEAYFEAIKILQSAHNDRRVWIMAGRLIISARNISKNITTDVHKLSFETKSLKIRADLYDILTRQPPEFFYGVEIGISLDEAAKKSKEGGYDKGIRVTSMDRSIPEKSIRAVWEAAQWPDDYSDPLSEDFSTQEYERLRLIYRRVHEFMEHKSPNKER